LSIDEKALLDGEAAAPSQAADTVVVYRKAALERLSSPDQLDRLVRVTTPMGWVALLSLGVLAVAFMAWALFGSVATEVRGEGVLLRPGGVSRLSAAAEGVVEEVRVDDGAAVQRGEVVARLRGGDGTVAEMAAPRDGRVLEVLASPGDRLAAGAPLLSLEGASAELVAVLFVPPAAGGELRPGLPVLLTPAAAERGPLRRVPGRVVRVAAFPATTQGMMRLLGNEALVSRLLLGGPLLRVDVALERLPAGGPALASGTSVLGRIVVREERPLDVILPGLGGRREG
jgi:hypothetical protein